MIGQFGRANCASYTLVVISHTKMLASACADATNRTRKSFDRQNVDSSGDTASNWSFSGLTNVYFTFDIPPSAMLTPFAFLSGLSSTNTISELA